MMMTVMLMGLGRSAVAADAAVGDSIALGTGHALGVATYARQNMGSCWIEKNEPLGPFTHVVVSAGINDGGACVFAIRSRLKARRVTWIIPAQINQGADVVWAAVKEWGDGFVTYTCKGGCTKTNFHPASYAVVARAVRQDWGRH